VKPALAATAAERVFAGSQRMTASVQPIPAA
jgi:hypothetical protein